MSVSSLSVIFWGSRRRRAPCHRLIALSCSKWRVLPLIACALGVAAQEVSPRPPLPALIHADQVRHLSPEQAALGYPVRIRGVITGDVPAPDFFIQDSTAGVYVEGSPSPRFSHLLGDLVELEGVTGPGKFAPVIRERSLRVLGKGKLPEARLYSFNEISSGQQDSQRVQIRGIVRSTSIDRTSWHELILAMNVASGGGQFKVRVPIEREQDFSSWIDSEVLIEGVCGSLFNSERQLAGVLFYVPRLSFITVEAPAKEVPFAALLKFSPDQGAGHRVRVRGVVAYQQLGDALFLQSQGKGLRVITQQDTRVEVGDLIDVLGFPAVGESAPALEDAVFHRIGHETSPEPVKLDLTVPWERYDGALVTTDAKLLQREQRPDGVTLLLQQGGIFFNATAHAPGSAGRLPSVPLNSELRITGICLVRSGGLWRVPESFRLQLRAPDDVVVLRAPSWWNLRHTLWLLGITAAVLLAMISWVVVLGRRLREQMAVIRQKLRSGAVLQERNRIARELHDTLEQELAGITMQLDLAVDCYQQVPRVARQALETARNMTRHSMREARRSVWDLRCHLLEHGDLVSALRQAVEPLALGNQIKVEVIVDGLPRRLDGPIEMNLLRIGQEAATNAVKHARAQNITLELQYHPEKVRLCVYDDGRGFSPSEAALSGNGHFGLLDMRERAQCLGCDLLIQSEPGGGTRIEVEVPVSPKEPPDAESKAHTYSGRG
jgi:signal transduction histidine kinase